MGKRNKASQDEPNKVGRPTIEDKERKQSFTISCTIKRRKDLVKKFGSLSKALDTVVL
jgi:hypothetical protein